MNQPTDTYSVECLLSYSQKDAIEIGHLLPYMSERFTGDQVPESVLRDIIDSPYHDQLVVRQSDRTIVGTATLSITMGVAAARNAWLEDFVIHPDIQGAGIGSKLWDAMIEWSNKRHAYALQFTSKPSRAGAHTFYKKHGAAIRDTNFFRKEIPQR